MPDETTDPPMLGLKASQTIDREYVKDRSLRMNEGVVGHVATTRKPLMVENVLDESPVKVLKADPHTSVCYSEETDSFGIVYFPQSRGATKGR